MRTPKVSGPLYLETGILADVTPTEQNDDQSEQAAQIISLLDGRPLALVGMMGAGKTTVGRRFAARLGRTFIDSDIEIEKAAGMSVEDIFASRGEAEFRAGEARVISRILKDKNLVLGTGGGAFIQPDTREIIKQGSISIWLKAEFDVLFARVSRRSHRPLLKTANPRQTLKDMIDARYPIYAEADITTVSRDVPHEVVADDIMTNLLNYLQQNAEKA